jgi:hypothetical protein
MRARFEGMIHGRWLFALLAFLLVVGMSIPIVITSEWSLGNQNLSRVSFDHFGW